MTHTYTVTGMTCTGCQAKVQGLLSGVPAVSAVTIDLGRGEATVSMERHVPVETLQAALKDHPKYRLRVAGPDVTELKEASSGKASSEEVRPEEAATEEAGKSWFTTYRPILLIFGYITATTLLIETFDGSFSFMRWMNHFMAGFFLVFSFFKLLDLAAFADSYRSYDIVASRWRGWGSIYPFAELALGILYLTDSYPVFTNAATVVIMGVSIIGVLRSVLQKKKIQCACLGAVFNLPMSTVTIIEDALMIVMSGYSLLRLFGGMA
jgi:copper chaperone CopZ